MHDGVLKAFSEARPAIDEIQSGLRPLRLQKLREIGGNVLFTRNVQLAVTWQIISEIMLFHGSELDIEIEQNCADSANYSLALTEGTLGVPYLRFDIGAQTVEVECPPTEHWTDLMDTQRYVSELEWNAGNYVEAFLARSPLSVILDIEAMAGFSRERYSPCGITRETLPVALIAGLLQQRMFASDAFEVTNAFRHSDKEDRCGVRAWARFDRTIPEWMFDEQEDEWAEKAKASLHLWKFGRAGDLNTRESVHDPGIVFDFEKSTITVQGGSAEVIDLWELYMAHQPLDGHRNLLNLLEHRLDGVLHERPSQCESQNPSPKLVRPGSEPER